uniref:Uncharacterized protein n=1 Tax=Panagrolaimus sp. ES5 TaxID=591445 RepID=A0AC34FUI8_9BILA
MVIASYKSMIYGQLGEVTAIAKMVNEQQIRGLGKVIAGHGYSDDVLAVIAHKHFNLADNEAMLETTVGDARISKPAELSMIDASNAKPNLISCNGDNTWYPVSFDAESKKMPKAFTDIEFLQNVSTYLMQNNLQDKLLLAARGKNLKDDVQYVERNDCATRTSEVKQSNEGDGVKTTYKFSCDPEGGITANVACVCAVCQG